MKKSKLKKIVGPMETIYYEGKPDKKCLVLESIFNPLLPFAIIWLVIDLFVMKFTFLGFESNGLLFALIPFFLIHLMPVWIYLFGVISSAGKYSNMEYIVTEKGVYYSSGSFSMVSSFLPLEKIKELSIHIGFFDKICKVGDICMNSSDVDMVFSSYSRDRTYGNIVSLVNLKDYEKLYDILKDLVDGLKGDFQERLRDKTIHDVELSERNDRKEEGKVIEEDPFEKYLRR